MPQRLSARLPEARKEHQCRTCYSTIAVGQVYSNETYVWEGTVYTWKTCGDCALICGDVYHWCADPDEGIGAYEYFEWALENKELPSAAAYLERYGYEDPED